MASFKDFLSGCLLELIFLGKLTNQRFYYFLKIHHSSFKAVRRRKQNPSQYPLQDLCGSNVTKVTKELSMSAMLTHGSHFLNPKQNLLMKDLFTDPRTVLNKSVYSKRGYCCVPTQVSTLPGLLAETFVCPRGWRATPFLLDSVFM